MLLSRCEYQLENGTPVIYLFCREGKVRTLKKILDFKPYFYVLKSEKDKIKGLKQDSQIYKSLHGEEVIKLYTVLPSDVPEIRQSYSKTFEADILFPTRYVIDEIDSLEPFETKTMFIDIETNSHGKVPDPMSAVEEIFCLSCHSDNVYTSFVWREDLTEGTQHQLNGESLVEIRYFKHEKEMLQNFLKYIRAEDPDVLTGWNFSRFDIPYIVNRLKRLGLNYNELSPMNSVYTRDEEIIKGAGVVIKGVAILDLYDVYKHMTVQQKGQEESYKLDYIGKKVIGIGKNESTENIRFLWKNNIDRLINYNLNDVLITVKVDQKMKLIDFMDEMRRLAFCNIEDCLTVSRTVDSYILRMFHNKVVFPTKVKHEGYSYEGATIENYGSGVYKNVVIFDIRSLYPSTIFTLNLSPETISDTEKPGYSHVDKIYVNQEFKGILPQVISVLFKDRTRYKELMKVEEFESPQYKIYDARQYSIKVLLNAIYGQSAYVNSRFYDIRVAETTTAIGRKILQWNKEFLEELDYHVIYMDTDANHFILDEEIDIQQIELIRWLLNESYSKFAEGLGAKEHIFSIEFEKIYRRAFYGSAKKRYAGAICYKEGKEVDKLETWGLETRRSDASQLTKTIMNTVLDMLLRQDKEKDEVIRYIGNEIDRIRKGNYKFSEIGMPKGITKELHEYGIKMTLNKDGSVKSRAGIQANIRGAIYAVKVLGLDLSNKPKMIYIKNLPNHLPMKYKFGIGNEAEEKIVDTLCFDEDNQVPAGTIIDIEIMLQKTVRDKIEPIFDALKWPMKDLDYHWAGKAPKTGKQIDMFAEVH